MEQQYDDTTKTYLEPRNVISVGSYNVTDKTIALLLLSERYK